MLSSKLKEAFRRKRNDMAGDPDLDLFNAAADRLDHLEWENAEMRRTFGSHPLFAEKDDEIARLKAALANK